MDIKDLIYKNLQAKTKQKFTDSSNIYSIGIDSLDLIEMITFAEDELDVRISDEELENIKNVGDIISAFQKKIKEK